jgi:hypothetical protein
MHAVLQHQLVEDGKQEIASAIFTCDHAEVCRRLELALQADPENGDIMWCLAEVKLAQAIPGIPDMAEHLSRAQELAEGAIRCFAAMEVVNGRGVQEAFWVLGCVYRHQGKRNKSQEMFLSSYLRGNYDVLEDFFLPDLATALAAQSLGNREDIKEAFIQKIQSGDPNCALAMLQALETPEPKLGKGCLVQIHGLRTESGKNLNGRSGIVLGKDAKTGRIVVDVSEVGKKLIQRANLSLIWPFLSDSVASDVAAMSDPRAYDIEAGLQASLDHVAQTAAEYDAPFMDSLMRSPQSISVVVLEYSRNEDWFRQSLMTSHLHQECRELASGAHAFFEPDVLNIVLQELERLGFELSKRHVVVPTDMEDSVRQHVESGRQSTSRQKRGSFKMKGRSEVTVDVPSPQSASDTASSSTSDTHLGPPCVLIKRTFIQVPVPSSLHSMTTLTPATI